MGRPTKYPDAFRKDAVELVVVSSRVDNSTGALRRFLRSARCVEVINELTKEQISPCLERRVCNDEKIDFDHVELS